MKMKSIQRHLKPYSITQRRVTTINHAFASAIAPCESYDPARSASAIRDLGQNPEDELACVYCGELAETWDHVYALVKAKQYSGYGHNLGNLVPCCRSCNARKGNRDWTDFLRKTAKPTAKSKERIKRLGRYFIKHPPQSLSISEIEKLCPHDLDRLRRLQEKIILLMKEADELAGNIRARVQDG